MKHHILQPPTGCLHPKPLWLHDSPVGFLSMHCGRKSAALLDSAFFIRGSMDVRRSEGSSLIAFTCAGAGLLLLSGKGSFRACTQQSSPKHVGQGAELHCSSSGVQLAMTAVRDRSQMSKCLCKQTSCLSKGLSSQQHGSKEEPGKCLILD